MSNLFVKLGCWLLKRAGLIQTNFRFRGILQGIVFAATPRMSEVTDAMAETLRNAGE